jgi:subtilisin family serine protease
LPQPVSSSCGPTDDNRAKPDIVAPGRFLAAAATDDSTLVITPSGSSYATPVVAGVIGLLAQEAKSDPNLAIAVGNGSGCVMKAILLTSARKLPYWQKGAPGREDDHIVPLDRSQGAGELDAVAAYELLRAGRQEAGNVGGSGWDLASLRLDGSDSRAYLLDSGSTVGMTITATLVWNRHYQQTYPFARDIARDTDLSLELWAYNEDGARLADHSDSRVDNLEHISFVAEPNERYFLLVKLSDNGIRDNSAAETFALTWRAAPTSVKDAVWYDLNGDGLVNVADAMRLIANLTATGVRQSAGLPGDLNGDGIIDLLDLVLLSKSIGNP